MCAESSSGGARQAEIHDLRHVLRSDDDVGRLDVTMHHGASMRFGKTTSHLDGNVNRFVRGKRGEGNLAGESLSLVIRHHNERTAVARLFNAVNDADIGMVERGSSSRFTQEAIFIGFGGDQFVRKEFQSDGALELEIERTVHDAHTARARKTKDFVVTYTVSSGRLGSCVRQPTAPRSGSIPAARSDWLNQELNNKKSAPGRNVTPRGLRVATVDQLASKKPVAKLISQSPARKHRAGTLFHFWNKIHSVANKS